MAHQERIYRTVGAGTRADIDVGLRAHMNKVYGLMAGGVALTGVVAYMVGSSPEVLQAIFGGPQKYLVMFAPLAFVMGLSFGIHKMSAATAQATFWAFAAVMGLSLSTIFVRFTGMNIAQTFFITAIAFLSLSIYGYTTKRSLSGMGSFLFMGLIGIVIASVVNIFLASDMLAFIVSAAGVLIFAGLTAYDTQKIKEEYMYFATAGAEGAAWLAKGAIMGALSLYLDFVNMFTMLLNLQSFFQGE